VQVLGSGGSTAELALIHKVAWIRRGLAGPL
jgi:hypothetical protein